MVLLKVCVHWVLVVLSFGGKVIYVAEFEEAEIAILSLSVMLDAFKTSKEECLSHDAKVGAKRVHDLH